MKTQRHIEQETIETALDNLKSQTGITGDWGEHEVLDAWLNLNVNNQLLRFTVEIKREIRVHQLEQLRRYKEQFENLILVALRIFPNVKKELRALDIPYLEANGNIYLKKDDTWLWIDKNPPVKLDKENGNRAFTKTGLKVIFHFLINPELVNQPQRYIANYTGVALGNIPRIIEGLKETGYLLNQMQNDYIWENRAELLDRWIADYHTTLKPTLLKGKFRVPQNWHENNLNYDQTLWGGEPAADILTNHLRPEEFMIYTQETQQELIRNYRIRPDVNGNLLVYNWFWKNHLTREIVHPLLIYADLILKNDKRCRETAKLIFDEHLQNIL